MHRLVVVGDAGNDEEMLTGNCMAVVVGNYSAELEKLRAMAASEMTGTAVQRGSAKLQVLSGVFAGRELELKKAITTIGRPGVQVAAITRRSDGYNIVTVDTGARGIRPRVNGETLGAQARRLNDNDVIEVAGVKMGFFLD
jgi:hypothetical protein